MWDTQLVFVRKGVKPGQILDWMNSDELAANLFRASVTKEKLRNDPSIQGQGAANQTHYDVGAAVRAFIVEQGATLPEDLPTPEQSIQQLEQAEQAAAKAHLQPPLLSADEAGGGSDTGSH